MMKPNFDESAQREIDLLEAEIADDEEVSVQDINESRH